MKPISDDTMPHGAPAGPGRPRLPDNQKAGAQIQVRTTAARKSAYLKAASPGGLTVWMFKHLDKAARFKP